MLLIANHIFSGKGLNAHFPILLITFIIHPLVEC